MTVIAVPGSYRMGRERPYLVGAIRTDESRFDYGESAVLGNSLRRCSFYRSMRFDLQFLRSSTPLRSVSERRDNERLAGAHNSTHLAVAQEVVCNSVACSIDCLTNAACRARTLVVWRKFQRTRTTRAPRVRIRYGTYYALTVCLRRAYAPRRAAVSVRHRTCFRLALEARAFLNMRVDRSGRTPSRDRLRCRDNCTDVCARSAIKRSIGEARVG